MRPLSPALRAAATRVMVVLLVAPAVPAWAAPLADAGSDLSVRLPGELSPTRARLAVTRGEVILRATARRQAGLAVGPGSLDSIEVQLELRNALGVTARAIELEVVLGREVPEGLLDPKAARGAPGAERSSSWFGGDGEKRHGSLSSPFEPLPGWRFRVAVDQAGAGSPTPVSARFPLPPLEESSRPSSLAELGYAVRVVGYRAPGMPLATAVAAVRGGAGVDARAAFLGYGDGLRGEARAFDEQILLGLLGAQPSREGRAIQAVVAREAPPSRGVAGIAATPTVVPEGGGARTPLELAFLLGACRRIGGQPTLEGLIMGEQRLGSEAPPLPERRDEAHPPENADLLPPGSFAAAVHETIVEVAHHNLGGLFLLLHAPPPPPPEVLVSAARQLALDEGLGEPGAWVEAALEIPREVPQFDPDTDREGRLPVLGTLARYGGEDVLPVLAHVLDAEELDLRDEAARALLRRGDKGLALLVAGLDTEDEARRAPVAGALGTLEGEGREQLVRQALERSAAVEAGASASEAVTALVASQGAERARRLGARLDEAEALLERDPRSARIGTLLAEARAQAPRAYVESRERIARIAARVYRARAAAGDGTARAILDEVAALGPISGSEFTAARRQARIAEARALAGRDLEGALRLLDEPDPSVRAVAEELALAALEAAVDGRDRARAERLLGRCVTLGIDEGRLAAPRQRLRRLRFLPWGLAAGALVATLAAALLVRRLRRPARRAVA